MKKKSPEPKRVLLAIDLKAEEPKLIERMASALRPLLKNQNVVVEPVTVLNREDAALGSYFKTRIGDLRIATARHLAEQVQDLGFKNLAGPQVLMADGSSTQRAVQALLSHARKSQADLLVVSSHSRKGVGRFLLGSFAETVSLQSPVPLLVVNPHQRVRSPRLKTLLFPTDLSDGSKAGLDIVCRSLPDSKPQIVLFHSYVFPVSPVIEPFAAYPVPQSVVEEDYKTLKKKGEAWAKALRAQGVRCQFLIDRRSESVTDAILTAARRRQVEMIAMVSTTGKWEARLLGSITRQVLRNSLHPVWVVHPSLTPETKRASLTAGSRTPSAAPSTRRSSHLLVY